MTPSEPAENKADLRRHFRAQRRAITTERRRVFDQAIRNHLLTGLAERAADHIAAFLAFDGEPDLEPLLRHWHSQGRALALPVVPAGVAGDMSMRLWSPDADLGRNVLGIREPCVGQPSRLEELDVVVMPLVAFNRQGDRLGMGAGYYDRFLATGPAAGPPLRIGVAYACQQAKTLPRDPWDVPLHAVVTEQGWLSLPA